MSFEIEKRIPIPPDGRGAPAKYPFRQMKVGDSFLVPKKLAAQVRGAAGFWRLKTGFTFTVRTVENGIRVWRTK